MKRLIKQKSIRLGGSVLGVVIGVLLMAAPCSAADLVSPDSGDRMAWWRDARFGMFVHWGLYSGLAGEWDGKSVGSTGGMEWIQYRVKTSSHEYAKRAIPRFKPKAGFAAEWAQLAKSAGCKYLVFTTKHHDGFALHDSQVSEFDAGSVLGRDLVKEIVAACRAEGLKIGFYHSVIDWSHDQFAYADSEQIPHPLRGQPYPNGSRDHEKYVAYLHDQANELVSNYGPIDILWWDYSVTDFQGEQAWGAFELMDLVRRRQPGVIMNNRLFRRPEAGWSGQAKGAATVTLQPKYGDFMTPEQHVPDAGIPGVDWETCLTMNTTWGYSKYDHAWKSTKTLLHTLIEAVSKGGNLLLNVGPMADGTIPSQSTEPLVQIGKWLQENGEAIYGASATSVGKPEWGRVTIKPKQGLMYLHVFDWPSDDRLSLEGVPPGYGNPVLLSGDRPLRVVDEDGGRAIDLTGAQHDSLVTVIKLSNVAHDQDTDKASAETDERLHSDGPAWGFQRGEPAAADLPRVLLIGDSILNGYRNQVSDALRGEAIVDLWVNPMYQSQQLNSRLAEILQQETYEVVHFNVGLHGWAEGRIKPGTFKPLTRAYVQVLRNEQPHAKLIWATSTPVTLAGGGEGLESDINPIIVRHNRLAVEVMREMQIPTNDFYALLVDKLDLARGDRFHWTPPAYKLLGAQAVNSIRAALADESRAR